VSGEIFTLPDLRSLKDRRISSEVRRFIFCPQERGCAESQPQQRGRTASLQILGRRREVMLRRLVFDTAALRFFSELQTGTAPNSALTFDFCALVFRRVSALH
jgi:hypothetical protein